MTQEISAYSMREALAIAAAHFGATALVVAWTLTDGTELPEETLVDRLTLLTPVITVEFDHGAFIYEHQNPTFGFAEDLNSVLAQNVRSLAAELGYQIVFRMVGE